MKNALDVLSEQYGGLFEDYLNNLAYDETPPRLREAMMYSLLAGGKRLRPVLCLAAAERCGLNPEKALPLAAAVEFIHTASLIHDDLPCMDNDDLRRGRATNHKLYGEALALIAGDALIIWAFSHALHRLPHSGVPCDRVSRAIALLAEAAGPVGMCGGQVLDTDKESRDEDKDFVRRIAAMKTGALIRASVVCGAALGDALEDELHSYHDYGTHLGLAFQVIDDILDVTSTKEELGKTPHKDEAQDKTTFVSVYGLEEARRIARAETDAARDSLGYLFPDGDALIDLAEYLAERNR